MLDTICAPSAGDDAETGLGQANLGAWGENTKGGCESKLKPTAKGGTANGGDRRDRHVGDHIEGRPEPSEEGIYSENWISRISEMM